MFVYHSSVQVWIIVLFPLIQLDAAETDVVGTLGVSHLSA